MGKESIGIIIKKVWKVVEPGLILILPAFFGLALLIPTVGSMRVSVSSLALERAKGVRTAIETEIEMAVQNLTGAAEEIGIEPERTDFILKRSLKLNPSLRSVSVVDMVGHETYKVDRYYLITQESLGSVELEPIFHNALQGRVSIGEVSISSEREPLLQVAIPIKRVGEVKGVLYLILNLRNLLTIVGEADIQDGHVYVVDRYGFQILHPDLTELLRRPSFSNRKIIQKVVFNQKVADGLSSEDFYINGEGKATFTVGVPMSLFGFGVFVEQERSTAFAPIRSVLVIGVATVFAGIMVYVVVFVGNRRIRKERERVNHLNMQLKDLNDHLQERVDEQTKEIKRAYEVEKAARKRLELLDKSKSEFITLAAHQLRTPLSGIHWALKSLIDHDFPSKQEEESFLRRAYDTNINVIGIVNDLLNVARIEEEGMGYNMKEHSIVETIHNIFKSTKVFSEQKNLHLIFDSGEVSLERFIFDQNFLSLALKNIIMNAIDYTPEGGIVTVHVTHDETMVHITVEDTGIGMSEEAQKHLFTKFYRGTSAKRMVTDRSGLGLYITKSIITRHKGSIFVQSKEGEGTTVMVTLPIRQNNIKKKKTHN